MTFTPTRIQGVWIVDQNRHSDDRGWFARTWCDEEFSRAGISARFCQFSASFNNRRGTLRGMHIQEAPHEEGKLVRCTRGAIFDVALDLRPTSPTFLKWEGFQLDENNGRAIYIPEGCAHGFQTIEADSEVLYHISVPFAGSSSRCWRWNDPTFSIEWPLPEIAHLSPRDAEAPFFPSATQAQ